MVKLFWLSAAWMAFVSVSGCGAQPESNAFPEIKRALTHKEKLPDFSAYKDSKEKKAAFFGYLGPIVLAENEHILKLREKLNELSRNGYDESERKWLMELAKYYELKDSAHDTPEKENFWKVIFRRVDVVPPSMVLAQAANESAWGTSRFAVQGNNLFGQWCYKKGCGLVPKHRTKGSQHEVAKFVSPAASVSSYMRNINSHQAYMGLRQMRNGLRSKDKDIDSLVLVKGLMKYSTRGEKYVEEIKGMIKSNNLLKYDL